MSVCKYITYYFYCKLTLLLNMLLLPGCFILSYDNDDFYNTCIYGVLPATRVIYDGLNGKIENKNITGCTSFGYRRRNPYMYCEQK